MPGNAVDSILLKFQHSSRPAAGLWRVRNGDAAELYAFALDPRAIDKPQLV